MVKKILLALSEVLARSMAKIGNDYQCYCCHKRVGRFLPYRGGMKNISAEMIRFDVIGSDVEHFSCPYCRSHDRERHLFMYFDKTLIWETFRNSSVLHFAPERNLARRIRSLGPKYYVKADLFPHSAEIVREDVTRLSFSDEMFDVVIANHVLEHVSDDTTAMKEVFRVLKPGGLAILQTPFSNILEVTSEDPMITSAAERLRAYGQEDHVRLYGTDLFTKIEATGLLSLVRTHEDILSDIDSSFFGVNQREPFFCYQRPLTSG